MTCDFCGNGRCLLCQLAQPAELGISSSHGMLVVEKQKGDLGDGNRRIPQTGTTAEKGASGQSGAGTVRMHHCPICGNCFKNLYKHYHQKHPGERYRP